MVEVSVSAGVGAAACLVLLIDLLARLRVAVPTVHGDPQSVAARAVGKIGAAKGFWPSPWFGGLLGGHLQTIAYGLGLFAPRVPPYELETLSRPDGGTIALAWVDTTKTAGPPLLADAPIVLILPGLGGSVAGSGYAIQAALMHRLRPVVLHRRGDGHALTSPNFNLFGDCDDVRAAVTAIRMHYPDAMTTPLVLCSTSAGTGLAVRMTGDDRDASPRESARARECV